MPYALPKSCILLHPLFKPFYPNRECGEKNNCSAQKEERHKKLYPSRNIGDGLRMNGMDSEEKRPDACGKRGGIEPHQGVDEEGVQDMEQKIAEMIAPGIQAPERKVCRKAQQDERPVDLRRLSQERLPKSTGKDLRQVAPVFN